MSTTKNPPDRVPDAALDGLYQGPLEEFTAARNELAKSLRADGEAAAADWVKDLPKPTRAAWPGNQLAARKASEAAGLLELGRQRRAEQRERRAGEKVEEAERRVHAAELDAHAARRALDEI